MKAFEGYSYIDGGVCAAKGFQASGTYCGIKKAMTGESNCNPVGNEKNDIALVVADTVCNAAAVYTQNKVKGAPVLVMQQHLAATGGKAKALIANSKNANTCNADGVEKAEAMCQLTANALGVAPEEIMVMSTGVIGQILPLEPIEKAVPVLCKSLSPTGNLEAATAIMTTDTVSKEVAVSFTLDGKTCHLGGMAKGSGMIHPNMATTLNCITTDAAISSTLLQKALSDVVKITYNCLSVDGDQSTNDTCLVMASGLAGNAEITEEDASYATFRQALYIVMMNLTRMLAKDGEGATKLLECTVSGAKDLDTAIVIAKSVICSPLFKCAMFGADANWGRVLCAVGYAPAEFDITKVAVTLASRAGEVAVCANGAGVPFSEEIAKKVLLEDEIQILVSVGDGIGTATAWGCDLTYDYVKINGDYRS
jgi:glutamate N-acetyltransferase/amino-acid N-acetyltransferase